MKVVKNIQTGRLVHREIPDFEEGKGIINAVAMGCGSIENLEEIEVTQTQWDAELALREEERPRVLSELLDTSHPNPQREAFKLSALYGLTQQQVADYIQNQIDSITSLAEAKAVLAPLLQKMAAILLWLVKQNRLDE